jgi:hypothetical protein
LPSHGRKGALSPAAGRRLRGGDTPGRNTTRFEAVAHSWA